MNDLAQALSHLCPELLLDMAIAAQEHAAQLSANTRWNRDDERPTLVGSGLAMLQADDARHYAFARACMGIDDTR